MLEPEFYFQVIDKPAQDSLARYADLVGKDTGQVIREKGPALGRYLAEATFPIAGMETSNPDGGSLAARNLGRDAVRRDIGRVYASPAKAYGEMKQQVNANGQPALANAFWRALKKGDLAYAEQLLRTSGVRGAGLTLTKWDGGALHQRKRNSRGRVGSGSKPVLVDDPKALKEYGKKIEKRVGFGKSAWINAARQIKPGGRIAAWIAGQAGPGRGVDETRGTEYPKISMTNEVRYIRKILTSRYELRAVEAFGKSLDKEIRARLEYLAAKETARVNAVEPGGLRQAA